MNIRSGRPKRWVVIVVAIAVVFICGLIAVGLAYAPVKYGTVALIARFGKLTGQILEPGLHWRIPFVDQVVVVPTVVISYETSDNPESSGADYRDYPVTAQTIDGQQINIKYTVLFRIPASQTVNIVQNVGRPQEVVENVVKAHSRNLSRLWAQSHTAEDLYSGEGIFAYEDAVRNALQQEFDRYGVALDDFLVRKIDFGEEYINAIEQQQIAQEAIETARYQSEAAEYEKERQIRLAEAEAERTKLLAAAEAERTKLLAAADAERQRLLADAEAYGIEARGKALKQYPELTQWEFIRNLQNVEWGILPDTGITPLLPVPPSAGQAESPESP
jgi:regulator of protease activity HflC (stomatin/prohibitin superfamily)